LTQVDYTLSPVDNKPTRRYRKGSKYDPIIDAFTEQERTLVEVVVEDKDANYLRTQLKKRIDARSLKIDVSVVNNKVYLEK
jgi:hypothetical protein